MAAKSDDDARWLAERIRPEARRLPQPIADVLSRLLARRGYAQVQDASQWREVWTQAAGRLASRTRTGKFQRGTLEIVVENSATLQELTFQKKKLIARINELVPQLKLKDLRFKVGELSPNQSGTVSPLAARDAGGKTSTSD
ncbi:MAG: DUF721 domain-containing protein [Pirellulaceae bacterium]